MDDIRNPVEKMLGEIRDALRREKDYRKEAGGYVDIYEARRSQPFAILYSNTETLSPSIYNNLPVPVVDRRYKDADPVAKASCEVGTRLLKFLIHEEPLSYDAFDDLMQAAVTDGLVTNRGLSRFRFDASGSEEEGYKDECVYGDSIRWDKFCHGYARTWKKVPWGCFELDMTKEEFEKEFPEAYKDMDFNNLNFETPNKNEDGMRETKQELTGVKIIKVFEVWDKRDKKQKFCTESYKKGWLRENDDPLKLKGFFPFPRPLNFQRKITTLIPTPLYKQYKEQAEELNELTRRLKQIIKAIKVRGFYDATVDEIGKVLEAEDNELVAIQNRASMPEGTKMDEMLWLMPIDKLVATAQQLYVQRTQCKQIIYEITGISDILRGSSVASETATAQNIKNQWGTLRLKKFQKEVQRYVRDCFRIMLEIAVTLMSQERIAALTNLQFPTEAQKAQVKQQIEMQMTQAQFAQQHPQIGITQEPPANVQQFQPDPAMLKVLQQPSWEEILGLLKNDNLRDYRIDIETNSTIDAEASQDKQDIAELMNAIAQFMNGIAPLIQQGAMPVDVAKGILLSICRRYTFGPELEEAIQNMKAPEPQADPAEKEKAAQAQMEAQASAAEAKAKMDQLQLGGQLAAQEHSFKMQELQLEHELKVEELQMKRVEMAINAQALRNKAEFNDKQHANKMKQAEQKKEPADV